MAITFKDILEAADKIKEKRNNMYSYKNNEASGFQDFVVKKPPRVKQDAISQAFEHFSNTDGFKNIAKQKNRNGGKYRAYLSRHRNGALKAGAMADILIKHGYKIIIESP